MFGQPGRSVAAPGKVMCSEMSYVLIEVVLRVASINFRSPSPKDSDIMRAAGAFVPWKLLITDCVVPAQHGLYYICNDRSVARAVCAKTAVSGAIILL